VHFCSRLRREKTVYFEVNRSGLIQQQWKVVHLKEMIREICQVWRLAQKLREPAGGSEVRKSVSKR
jgi:hypothetical protein